MRTHANLISFLGSPGTVRESLGTVRSAFDFHALGILFGALRSSGAHCISLSALGILLGALRSSGARGISLIALGAHLYIWVFSPCGR